LRQYLGHRNIQHTTRYTDLAPNRFKDFWRDQKQSASRGQDESKIRYQTDIEGD
jgi:hypothetical protein